MERQKGQQIKIAIKELGSLWWSEKIDNSFYGSRALRNFSSELSPIEGAIGTVALIIDFCGNLTGPGALSPSDTLPQNLSLPLLIGGIIGVADAIRRFRKVNRFDDIHDSSDGYL